MKRNPEGKDLGPLRLPLTTAEELARNWHIRFDDTGDGATYVTAIDRLLTRDEVLADTIQMFVNRLDEDFLSVAAFHFPFVRGMARQIRFTVPLTHLFRTAANVTTFDDSPIVEQAIVDFEQLCLNFMPSAFRVLLPCAYLLATTNPAPPPPIPDDAATPPTADDDGLAEFIVTVNLGWPRGRPRYKAYDVVRADPALVEHDVKAGYLVLASEVETNLAAYGPEYREALAKYRNQRAVDTRAAKYRPSPTDIDAFLQTSEGRRIQRKLRAAFLSLADQVFPTSSPGQPPKRSEAERKRLREQLIKARRGLQAKLAAKGERTGKVQYLPLLARLFGIPEDEIDKLLWPRKKRGATSSRSTRSSKHHGKARKR